MLTVVVIWAANISIVKAALAGIGPLPFTAVRFTSATLLLVIVLRVQAGSWRVPRALWGRLVLLGLVGNTAYQFFFILGLSQTTSANSAMIMGTTPAIIALTGGLLGLEKLTRHVIGGVTLALAGVAIVMSRQGAAVSAQTLHGDLLMLCAVFCWTAYVLGMRTLGGQISSLGATTFTLLTGTPGLVLLGSSGLRQVQWARLPASVWFGLAYSSLLALVVGYVLYNSNIKRIGGVRTGVYSCAIPLLATLIAWPVLGERPHWWHAVGGTLIIGGVLLARRETKEEESGTLSSQ
ncbi:MAG: DMT family transporter [Acidobacteria bacterium]|nr:DMT family transporter [Acidobacteriota bacterium]MBI3421794.1 DMT family transporter [Acidobacteriota bacterium]